MYKQLKKVGIGDWGLGPIPNPQSPIPKHHITSYLIKYNIHIIYFIIKIHIKI